MRKLSIFILVLISILTVSCGGSKSSSTKVDNTVVTTPDEDVEEPVEETVADKVDSSIVNIDNSTVTEAYVEQGSSTKSLSIKCAPASVVNSHGKLVFKITTGSGGNIKVYRLKYESGIASEDVSEIVYLKADSVYYLYTQFNTSKTFGVTSGNQVECNI